MTDSVAYCFEGFSSPESGFTRIPNEFMEMELSHIESLAELKVILYLMRHTWGFQEYDELKKMTFDEFMHGRKRKDGTRLDNGTGLSRPSVKDGLIRAITHEYIEWDIDDDDKARIKKSYCLKMRPCV